MLHRPLVTNAQFQAEHRGDGGSGQAGRVLILYRASKREREGEGRAGEHYEAVRNRAHT